MSNLNTKRPVTLNHEGSPAVKLTPKKQLAMMAVSTFFGDSFYERSLAQLEAMQELVAKVPASYVDQLAHCVREEFNMRATAAALLAFRVLEYGSYTYAPRLLETFSRGDEIGDFLAVVNRFSRNKKVTKAAFRTVNIVLNNLTERQALRYPNHKHLWSLSKAIGVARPRPKNLKQSALFAFIRKGGNTAAWQTLTDEQRALLPVIDKALHNTGGENDCGDISWERSHSAGVPFERLINKMGYMAILRNLRNFVQQVSEDNHEFWDVVCNTISDPEQVAKSKQFPFSFMSAYKSLELSPEYGEGSVQRNSAYRRCMVAIETALNHSARSNIPKFAKCPLIIVDVSGSMDSKTSDKSTVTLKDIAVTFAAMLKYTSRRAEVVSFATLGMVNNLTKPEASLLEIYLEIKASEDSLGGSTNLHTAFDALRKENKDINNYDTIVIFSDMQLHDSRAAREHLSNYTGGRVVFFNLAHYQYHVSETPKSLNIGGWSDTALKLLSLTSSGGKGLVEYVEQYVLPKSVQKMLGKIS